MKYPDDNYTRNICKIGQGAECCRYLVMGKNGWSCEKHNPQGRLIIDRRVALGKFTAIGDNCEGLDSR